VDKMKKEDQALISILFPYQDGLKLEISTCILKNYKFLIELIVIFMLYDYERLFALVFIPMNVFILFKELRRISV
jgi:hypothetical protein